jgi:hypothetical protein
MIFFILAFYELLCIMKLYRIGIPKSETVSDQSISNKGHRTVLEKNGSTYNDTAHQLLTEFMILLGERRTGMYHS